ncbi:hypothetical protein FACS1894172_09170 [Spirochaetia bacterium]|nr:hypothetical protein FACS1894172_09170 [Spirochaetia bacterium]
MKSFAFHLQKGGVGKTSLSVSTAWALSKIGRTILIDCDPQGNTSSWLITEPPKHELAKVLYGQVETGAAIVSVCGLDVLPTFGIDGELKRYGENKLPDEPFIFCDLVAALQTLGYQFVVFDLSPGMGRLERAVLTATDVAITPMTPEIFSLDGIEIFSSELEMIRKNMRRAAQHTHIVVNAFDNRIAQHKAILGQIAKLKWAVIVVPVDPVFRKAQAVNMPIGELRGTDAAKKETLDAIDRLAGELSGRGEK